MGTTSKTQSKIRSKLDAIKKINDQPDKSVDELFDLIKPNLSAAEGFLARKPGDFKDKRKAKKTERKDIFDELIKTTESFIGANSKINPETDRAPFNKNILKNYAKDSARVTLRSSKQMIIDSVNNVLFSGDGVCGVNNEMPVDDLVMSPKEFDFINMLTVPPTSTSGKIMYESTINKGFIKMNTEFYNAFDSVIPYNFYNKDYDSLFELSWSATTQNYHITGLQGLTGNTKVQDFLLEYYSAIEYPDIDNVIKQAMLFVLNGDGTDPKSFVISIDKLERLLDKLFAICGHQLKPNENQLNQPTINEDDEDIEWYFDFDDVEGIDLDAEDARLRRVLKFRDCNNFEIPVNTDNIEDFVYFSNKNKDLEEAVTNALGSAAMDAYENSDKSINLEDFKIAITSLYIKQIPRALISAILSPKMIFPITVIYKSFKGLDLNINDLMKKLTKLFYDIIKNVFYKFLSQFWAYVKKDLLLFVKEIGNKILINKLKRSKTIITSLLALLIKLLQTNLDNCEAIFNAILMTINGALSAKVNVPIPGILLALSGQLPGFSTDKAQMNITERLSAYGIETGPLYGRDNKLGTAVKSIVEGYMEEMDTNGYIKIGISPTIIPVAVAGAVLGPNIVGYGKIM